MDAESLSSTKKIMADNLSEYKVIDVCIRRG